MIVMESKKEQRKERKRKKLLAEYELARSNDEMKRPGELLDSDVAKNMKLDGDTAAEAPGPKAIPSAQMEMLKKQLEERKKKIQEFEGLKSKFQFQAMPVAENQAALNVEINSKKNSTDGTTETQDRKRLSPEEFKLMKKQLAERKKILQQFPRFQLQAAGLTASLTQDCAERAPILMCDVQHLLLYTLCGNNGINQPHRWCTLQKHNNITHMVVLVLEGLTSNDFLINEHLFPKLTRNFESRVEVLAPSHYGSGVPQELASVPLSGTQKSKILDKFGTLEAAVSSKEVFKVFRSLFRIRIPDDEAQAPVLRTDEIPKLPPGDMFSRTYLLLSPSQMMSESFPLNLEGKTSKFTGFRFTKSEYKEVSQFSPLFAIDCEMCMTEVQSELTRIAVVNEQLEVVYESLVKPKNKIVNYLTRFSGITKEILENVTATLEDVQTALEKILPEDAILVGHSLNCDLQAMQVIHPYVIDTSTIFNMSGYRGRKSKLADLSTHFLKENIQQAKTGHCPTEDASTAMKLVKLKLAKGFHFGDFSLNQETATAIPECQLTSSIFSHTRKVDKTVALVGSETTLETYKSYSTDENSSTVFVPVPEDDHKATIGALKDAAVNHNFALAHINLTKKLEKVRKSSTPNKVDKLLKKVDTWCDDVYNHVSINGFCTILFSGPTNTKTLLEQKYETDANDDSFTLNGNDKSSSSPKSSQQEIAATIDTNPRQANGVCFVTINTPKKPR